MEWLKIDGTGGEGGGQILRTAVSLSCVTGRPVWIEGVRRGRKIAGLRAQHLTAIKLLAKVCNASVDGLEIGSESVRFAPNAVQDMELSCSIGTAGAISLALQAVIVPVAVAGRRLRLEIAGGTDVPWSPTSDYARHVLLAAYSRMGIGSSLNVRRRGYYPKGGGMVSLRVHPSNGITATSLTGREDRAAKIFCTYWGYRQEDVTGWIAELRRMLEIGGWGVATSVKEERAACRGGAVTLVSQDTMSVVGADGLPNSEGFATDVAERFLGALGVDSNLADMLVVPASVADGTTVYRVGTITSHMETSLRIAAMMTGCKYSIARVDGGYEIRIHGSSDACV